MPTLKKIPAPAVKPKGKRGRPKGAENKVSIHRFIAKDGCVLETGIRNVSADCHHGYEMEYKETILQ